MTAQQYTVLVMAANRHGQENPIAKHAGVSHKCLAEVAGMAMIERVVRAIKAVPRTKHVLVSIETGDVLDSVPYISELRQAGDLNIVESGRNLMDSVLKVTADLKDEDYPILITTADNVLHTQEIVETFSAAAETSGAEVAFGLTPRSVIEKYYPVEAPDIGYLKLAGEEHSNCNIYYLRSHRALPAVRAMRDGGQFRSHPWRLMKAFGFVSLFLYVFKLIGAAQLAGRLQKVFGVPFEIVIMPYPDAPIDADNLTSYALVERILMDRQSEN